ncbi:hypothetical protein ACQPZP_43770 [Spirillospora sp. CA-142024]|uniref:hypothetical protein n=1 Tax=Spirillospora sp. CA-142024 TaxID=3240036 RepID=UPI003D8A3830
MSEHGPKKITWERLRDPGRHSVPWADGPSYVIVGAVNDELEGVTHLFVVMESETEQPSVHLMTEWGVADLDDLRGIESLIARGMGLAVSAERYRRPLNELCWYDRWRILHWDYRGLAGGVRPEEFAHLRESSGTCGLSLNELEALRLIIDRFRTGGDDLEALLRGDHGPDGEGEIGTYFGLGCNWLRSETRRPATVGERGLAMTLAVLRTLQKLRLPTGRMTRAIEDRLHRDVVLATVVGSTTLPEIDK